MKTDEMRNEYDMSRAKRGVLPGKIEKKQTSNIAENSLPASVSAVCVETFDAKSLIPRKIYSVAFLPDNLVRVVDEAGGEEIYPAKYFLRLSLPVEIENVLAQIAV